MTLRILIADDEPLARRRLRDLLDRETDVEVVAECRDGQEVVEAVEGLAPDLLLLDVQMPECDGFEALGRLRGEKIPPVIFVTAYDQYALQAFEVHAFDYLLKPVASERFREALGRARSMAGRESEGELRRRLAALLEEVEVRRRQTRRFAVRVGNRIRFVTVDEVDCIEAAGNYVQLHAGRERHLVRETMDGLERRLDPERFVRVHRSWIVNAERIAEVHPWFHHSVVLVLRDGRKIRTGRSYRRHVGRLLENRP